MNTDAIEQILTEEVTFFTDELNGTEVYVEYTGYKGDICFESVGSRYFRAFLSFRYRKLTETTERPDYKALLENYVDDAIFMRMNPVKIHHRVAGSLNKKIVYSLADALKQRVVISADGWKLVQKTKTKFLNRPTEMAQAIPCTGGELISLLLPRLNMDHDDALLYIVFLVQGFSRSSSHFAAVISSAKGTGKSTLTKITQELIDPVSTSCALTPTTESDLKTALAGGYVASFDNTDALKTSFSNILCAAITGSKEVKRKLYKDADLVVLNLHNLVLINGIDVVPFKSDLAERSLYFELKKIPEEKRKTDHEIWTSFKKDKPQILGAIFDTLVNAMKILPTLKVEKRNRMAEAHVEMVAIAMALGIPQDEFQKILDANNRKLQDAYAQNNAFVEQVLSYFQKHAPIDMPAEKLFSEMRWKCTGDTTHFPKSASALSRKLNEESDALNLAGFYFDKYKKSGNNYIKITRIPQSQQTKAQKEAATRRSKLMNASTEEA